MGVGREGREVIRAKKLLAGKPWRVWVLRMIWEIRNSGPKPLSIFRDCGSVWILWMALSISHLRASGRSGWLDVEHGGPHKKLLPRSSVCVLYAAHNAELMLGRTHYMYIYICIY